MMKMFRPALLSLTLLILLIVRPEGMHAQFYTGSQLTFGKNRVQFSDRFWSFFRFEKFDTYFYLNGKELAVYTARYADKCLKSVERKLDYTLEDKIQFIVFNRFSELQESNIGLINDEVYNTGGMTHIVGTKVFIFFNGSHTDLEKQIRAGIARVIIDEMMYGGKITTMIKNSALMSLPAWYVQGLVSFISDDWNSDIDNHVKDGILNGTYRKYNNLSGPEAVYAGHSIWKFISDKYGPAAVSNIVYLTKISRSVESGFLYVIGVPFKSVVADWLAYYEKIYNDSDASRSVPETSPIQKKSRKPVVYQQLKISPDGKYAAYVSNIMGQYHIWIRDMESGKSEKLIKRGYKSDEKTDYSFPLLAWHPSGRLLAITFEHKGKNLLYFYTLDDEKFEKQQLFNLEKILDMSFSQNGRFMVMSGVIKGQSDIYVYSLAAHTYEPITKDIYDDLNPRFVNNSTGIVFASNRPGDTIVFEMETNLESPKDTISSLPQHTDIFLYQYSSKNPALRRVTSTPDADEIMPMQYDKKYFTYLGNDNGIYNRYMVRLDSAITYIDTTTHYRYFSSTYPITDYSRNILEHDVVPQAGKTAEIMMINGKYDMYIHDLIPAREVKKLKPTNTYFRELYLKSLREITYDTNAAINQEEIELLKKKRSKTRNKKVTNVLINEMDNPADSGKVDINNYSFGSGPEGVNIKAGDSVPGVKRFAIPRQENYNVEYSINQLVGQIDFNYLNAGYQQFTGGSYPIYLNTGLDVFFKLGIIDLMEDYRITGGARISLSFDNNEFFIGFENLKKRLDKSWFFYHQAQLGANDYSVIKLRSNALYYVLKWPFSRIFAVKGTASVRYDRKVYASTDVQNLKTPDVHEFWGGIKGELVYDNTQYKAINIYYGWRWKVFGEYYQLISDKFNNLVVLGLDLRHYQKIHRTFIWANRFAASTSFGNSKLIYYLGGVDSWIIPRFNSDVQVSPNQNYAYQTLATNMRGFRQNIRNGNNFAVINSELRFPIFRYFANKPIKNEFLANFQIIGFGDIGTAWTGWNPFSEENTTVKQVIQQGPIKVTLIKKQDPIVGGFGAGLRTKLLGYFIRADYAWGVENGKIQKPIFYISLSLDF